MNNPEGDIFGVMLICLGGKYNIPFSCCYSFSLCFDIEALSKKADLIAINDLPTPK
jgi:hypothetical protein